MAIHFYKESDVYGEFSNFARYPIVIEDVIWHTSEHYFQAMKFPHDRDYQEKIRTTKARRDIKRLGGNREIKLRPDWEGVKEDILVIALRAKFDQYPELKQLLLSTAGKSLVEHTENDNYWGDAGDGSGLNRLGELLVELRDYLNNDKPPT
ncbi:MAG: NADAR family protein [Candidatus Fonsibacter sp.]